MVEQRPFAVSRSMATAVKGTANSSVWHGSSAQGNQSTPAPVGEDTGS